jgi:TolB protein
VGDSLPTVSPDGRTIAFFSTDSIWAAGSDGTGRIVVTTAVVPWSFGRRNHGPAWSPDGSRLVVAGQEASRAPIEIWAVDARGTNVQRLTADTVTDRNPAWSPDGRWIAWTRDVGSQRQIWVMAADGGGARPLIVGGEGEHLDRVGWAPDPG